MGPVLLVPASVTEIIFVLVSICKDSVKACSAVDNLNGCLMCAGRTRMPILLRSNACTLQLPSATVTQSCDRVINW